jgi:cell division protein FtsX
METLGLLGAAAAFFAVGLVLVLYELSRIKAGRPILQGSQAVQLYYITYLTMFVLAVVTGLKAVIG